MNALFNALYFRNERAEQLWRTVSSHRFNTCSLCYHTALYLSSFLVENPMFNLFRSKTEHEMFKMATMNAYVTRSWNSCYVKIVNNWETWL